MGHIEVDVVISDVDGKRSAKARALVDTGATLSIIPSSVFEELDLKFSGEKVKVSTAKGSARLNLTYAWVEVAGKKRLIPALVSRDVNRVLLGVTALESMQLKVNPITEKLEEHPALLYAGSRRGD